MTLLVLGLVGFALFRVVVNSAAIARAPTPAERMRRGWSIAGACVAIVVLLLVMKGAGFVVGLGVLVPVLVIGGLVLGGLALFRMMGVR